MDIKKAKAYISPILLIIAIIFYSINFIPGMFNDPYSASPYPSGMSILLFIGIPLFFLCLSLKSIFTKDEKKYRSLNIIILAILILLFILVLYGIYFKNGW